MTTPNAVGALLGREREWWEMPTSELRNFCRKSLRALLTSSGMSGKADPRPDQVDEARHEKPCARSLNPAGLRCLSLHASFSAPSDAASSDRSGTILVALLGAQPAALAVVVIALEALAR